MLIYILDSISTEGVSEDSINTDFVELFWHRVILVISEAILSTEWLIDFIINQLNSIAVMNISILVVFEGTFLVVIKSKVSRVIVSIDNLSL